MNKQRIALVTDSCADIPAALLKKYPIYVIPLKIRFGDNEYLDGVTIQPSEIYRRQKDELPRTSLPDGALIETRSAGSARMDMKKCLPCVCLPALAVPIIWCVLWEAILWALRLLHLIQGAARLESD